MSGIARSRPLHGESIYLPIDDMLTNGTSISSRPLHGESIYLQVILSAQGLVAEFSSPPRGIYISTYFFSCFLIIRAKGRSRPLHGESIYLQMLFLQKKETLKVLVPSTGNLYIYNGQVEYLRKKSRKFSSPPRGIYISTDAF